MVEIKIDPLTRLEGHSEWDITVEDGKVTNAKSIGPMFRGFEIICQGRDPRDALFLTQRICGVCIAVHGHVAAKNIDMAYGYRDEIAATRNETPANAVRIRNAILAANTVWSHALHQYALAGFEYLIPNPNVLVALAQLEDWATIAGFLFGADPFGAPGSAVFGPPATPDVYDYVKDTVFVSQLGVPTSPVDVAGLLMEGGYVPVGSILLNLVLGLTDAIKGEYIPGYRKYGGASWVNFVLIGKRFHKLEAIFGARAPFPQTNVPGGVGTRLTLGGIASAYAISLELRDFIRDVMLRDMAWIIKWRNLYFPPPVTPAAILATPGAAFTEDAYNAYQQYGVGPRRYVAYGVYEDPDNAYKRFLSRGVLYIPKTGWADRVLEDLDPNKIKEYVKYSWYKNECSDLNPKDGKTIPDRDKAGAYTWAKSPRYDGKVAEVGPHARVVVSLARGTTPDPKVELKALAEAYPTTLGILSSTDLLGNNIYDVWDEVVRTPSALGRIAARAYEAWLIAKKLPSWILAIDPVAPVYKEEKTPTWPATSIGLTEAPRGALGHWMTVGSDGKIERYQVITPTNWNISSRDDMDQPGPAETALMGMPGNMDECPPTPVVDTNNPLELLKVLRSFDFCLSCTVHVIDARTGKKKVLRIG